MAFSTGSSTRISYVKEVTFGTTPGTPDMKILPYSGSTLELTKEAFEDPSIRGDRNVEDFRHGTRSVAGDITFAMRADDYDELIEAALFSSFNTAGIIKNGITPTYLSIEVATLNTDYFEVYKGCTINTFSISATPNALINGTFGIIGRDKTLASTPLEASPTASSGASPFDGFGGAVEIDGVPFNSVTAINFQIENNIEQDFVIGSNLAANLSPGRFRVTGTIEAYVENATLMNTFLEETLREISIDLSSSVTGATYTFLFPAVKFNSGSSPVSTEQSKIQTFNFAALYDTGENAALVITKV